jgi:FMN-dependent NADH-azoreductase
MNTLLQINTSIHGNNGQSSRLAAEFIRAWRARNPGAPVIVRDLGAEAVPHLTAERFAALAAKPEARDAAQQTVAAYSNALVDELRRADVIVLGLPVYNFGVPSTLKAYFDHVARAGVTFRYTADGPVGLLAGKTAYVCATRGGRHAGTPLDTETAYVRDFLRFVGMDDVRFVYAEGLALDAAAKEAALAAAGREIARLARPEFPLAA